MFESAILKVNEALFPVFWELDASEEVISCGISGSAFFINDQGDFISAAHVFAGDARKQYLFVGRTPGEVLYPRPIIERGRDEVQDLFLGHVELGVRNPFLALGIDDPLVDQDVCAGGYPERKPGVTAEGKLDLSVVDRHYQPSQLLGETRPRARTPGGPVGGPGLLLNAPVAHGMSGGPVFDVGGIVLGVLVSGGEYSLKAPDQATITVRGTRAIKSSIIGTFLGQCGVRSGRRRRWWNR